MEYLFRWVYALPDGNASEVSLPVLFCLGVIVFGRWIYPMGGVYSMKHTYIGLDL